MNADPLSHAQNGLSGSFETSSVYYSDDAKTGAQAPGNHLGSNNYFKVDYQYKAFSAGVQFESYLPVLQGLPSALKGSELVLKYASFKNDNLDITIGDFYEQLGNGLIYRAFEERSLGLNTSLEGVRVAYNIKDMLFIKGLAGRPRYFMDKAESIVKGGSVFFDIGNALRLKQSVVSAEANIINRHENYAGQEAISPNVNAYSFRGSWAGNKFSAQSEYAYKTAEASVFSNNKNKDGSALLVELGYNTKGFGSLLAFRRLEFMQMGTMRSASGIGRELNYLPALTKQHVFSLASLNPHNTVAHGEMGGQLDLNYQVQQQSIFGGRYGTAISFNASAYYNLNGSVEKGFSFFKTGGKKYYRDLNVEVKKQLSSSVTTHFLFSSQLYNPAVIGKEDDLYTSEIVAGDALWKISNRQSFRFELQHLWSRDYLKNWGAALVEYAAASDWSCFISDMYNYGSTNVHYYKAGASYTRSRTRLSLQYGRNREGIICTGGICLYMPAYTGTSLSLVTAF
ncbi:hypothetical protein GCM10027516_40380 [Niabella aquatica]